MVKIRTRSAGRAASWHRKGDDGVTVIAGETPAPGATDAADDGDDPRGAADREAAPSPQGQDDPLGQGEGVAIGLDDQTVETDPAEDARARNLRMGREKRFANIRMARGKREPSAPRPPSSEKPEKEEKGKGLDAAATKLLLTMVQAMTVAQLGPDAAFTSQERGLIEPPLTRILARMSPSSAKMFSAVADPILLCTGLLMWGTRVFAKQVPPLRQPIRPDFGAARPSAATTGPPVQEPGNIAPTLEAAWEETV